MADPEAEKLPLPGCHSCFVAKRHGVGLYRRDPDRLDMAQDLGSGVEADILRRGVEVLVAGFGCMARKAAFVDDLPDRAEGDPFGGRLTRSSLVGRPGGNDGRSQEGEDGCRQGQVWCLPALRRLNQ